MPQYYFLSPQPRFITGPSFLKCKVLTIKHSLIIVLPRLSHDIASLVISMIHLEALTDIFLHSFHSPAVPEKHSNLCICLPHSLLCVWLRTGRRPLFMAPSSPLDSSGLNPDHSHCLFPSSLHVPFFLVPFPS